MRSLRFVCHLFVLSVILMNYYKNNQPISLLTWYYDWVYQSEELVNFWWWSGPGHGFRITVLLTIAFTNAE